MVHLLLLLLSVEFELKGAQDGTNLQILELHYH